MKRRDSDRLNAAIERLAAFVPCGALRASTDPAGLLNEVCDMLQAREQTIARAVEAEREACAALVDEEATGWAAPWDSHEVAILSRVAKAIRARGET